MNLFSLILTIIGLSLFEAISSIDNAIINAEVLKTTGEKAKKWFLSWGIIMAVFVMRGILPFILVWGAVPSLGPIGVLTSTLSPNESVAKTIEQSASVLLIGGGIFLVFLFLHWLFMEPKSYGLYGERFFHSQGPWFYAVSSASLAIIVWYSLKINPMLSLGAVIGSTGFFIVHGFQHYAEKQEENLNKGNGLSDLSKLLYLEVIDASFSIDGVVGAFAFTFAVPLIFLGNGIGAIVLRHVTVNNIERIKKYIFLKNGAMYSILFLGVVMVLESFGFKIPSFISPVATIIIISYFFLRSKKEYKKIINL
ncbi:MAG: DUF475 domain-containing protein [Patescibacteria group bacterium]|nr:DUF475 domain-containing protein [Patescibacteria group bacterium]